MQREAHDVEVAASRAVRGERHGGVRLGAGSELGESAAQGVDEERKADPGFGCLDLVETDVEGEATGRADGGKICIERGRRGRRRGGAGGGGGGGTLEKCGVRHDDEVLRT